MTAVLCYAVAFGKYDIALAKMMVESLRATSFRGDILLLTDEDITWPGTICVNVAAHDKAKQLESPGPRYHLRCDGVHDYLLAKLCPREFYDVSKYEVLFAVDTDVLFFQDPSPHLLAAGEGIVTVISTPKLAGGESDDVPVHEASGDTQRLPRYNAGLLGLPRAAWDVLDQMHKVHLESRPQDRQRYGLHFCLDTVLRDRAHRVRVFQGVSLFRKVEHCWATHYSEYHHDNMQVDFRNSIDSELPILAVGSSNAANKDPLVQVEVAGSSLPLPKRPPSEAQSRLAEPRPTAAGLEVSRQADRPSAKALLQHAMSLQQQNKISEAADCLRRLLRQYPEHVEGLAQLGIVLARAGKQAEGIACFQEALRLQPDHAFAHNNLGVALAELGRSEDALAAWQKAVQVDPMYPEAHFNLGVALADRQKTEQATTEYLAALALRPGYVEAYNNLGLLRVEQRRPEEAVILLEQALRLRPDFADAHNNLGLAFLDIGRLDDALASYREALKLRPLDADSHNNLGTAYAALGRMEEALACYELALRLKPEYPEVRWHRALAWLQKGLFTQGWQEYEWRWRRKRSCVRKLPRPLWDGKPFAGKTILLWCEQGLGDTIQFVRFVPLVKALGGEVLLECPAGLMPLFKSCQGVDRWIPEKAELPSFHMHAPLMSLPWLLNITMDSIPCICPYLSADSHRAANWRQRIERAVAKPSCLKIGVAWQGNPKHRWDRHRSFALNYLQGIAGNRNIRLFSLQKGAGVHQLSEGWAKHSVVDFGGELDGEGLFLDSAALMQSLDLVITCDSALAHLAGALGIKVWVALSTIADWRWLTQRQDTPWYPTLQLFRQKKLGDWESVFWQMEKAIETTLLT